MKRFKQIIIFSCIIFLINFPAHFIYDWFPNFFTKCFFPTNESIFEHLKMIFTSFFIFYSILFLTRKKHNIKNIFIVNLFSSMLCIFIFLLIYLPVYINLGENFPLTISLLFLCILVSNIITYFIYNLPLSKALNKIAFLLILSIFSLNIFLTFNPPNSPLFIDPTIKQK